MAQTTILLSTVNKTLTYCIWVVESSVERKKVEIYVVLFGRGTVYIVRRKMSLTIRDTGA